jgi:hypothetical protein
MAAIRTGQLAILGLASTEAPNSDMTSMLSFAGVYKGVPTGKWCLDICTLGCGQELPLHDPWLNQLKHTCTDNILPANRRQMDSQQKAASSKTEYPRQPVHKSCGMAQRRALIAPEIHRGTMTIALRGLDLPASLWVAQHPKIPSRGARYLAYTSITGYFSGLVRISILKVLVPSSPHPSIFWMALTVTRKH